MMMAIPRANSASVPNNPQAFLQRVDGPDQFAVTLFRNECGMPKITPERSHLMGDKKSRKDVAKGKKQKEAKAVKTAKEQKAKNQSQPGTSS
ncbi:MAG: hypothetical protein ACI9QL_001212 [Candidatus Omnitrophota bacterium]|jgi:hypothetical protein